MSGHFSRFGDSLFSRIFNKLKNFNSLFTGERNVFRKLKFAFGTMNPPTNFNSNGNIPSGSMPGGGRPNFKPSISDLPLEFMFSNILSTIITVLIFLMVFIYILFIVLKKE